MKKLIYTMNICILVCLMLTGCGTEKTPVSSIPQKSAEQATAVSQTDTIDYLVLVNKENPLPEDWENIVETIHMTNSLGDDVEVEKAAYDAYLELKAALEKEECSLTLTLPAGVLPNSKELWMSLLKPTVNIMCRIM